MTTKDNRYLLVKTLDILNIIKVVFKIHLIILKDLDMLYYQLFLLNKSVAQGLFHDASRKRV